MQAQILVVLAICSTNRNHREIVTNDGCFCLKIISSCYFKVLLRAICLSVSLIHCDGTVKHAQMAL